MGPNIDCLSGLMTQGLISNMALSKSWSVEAQSFKKARSMFFETLT